MWLGLLPIGSVGVILLSVPRQWKPFLATGLVYLAAWYVRAFVRAEGELEDPARAWIALTLSLLLLGCATMVLAWLAPFRVAGGRGRGEE